MKIFNWDACEIVLKMVSTAAGGLLAGGNMYISIVDQPSRMTHDPAYAVIMFKQTTHLATRLLVYYHCSCSCDFFSLVLLILNDLLICML